MVIRKRIDVQGMNVETVQQTISLKKFIFHLREARWQVAGILCVGLLISLGAAYLRPMRYEAGTTILPPTQPMNGISAAITQIGPLSSAVGLATKQVDELYAALLLTNQVKDRLIKRFELKEQFGCTTLEETRTILGSRTRVSADKKTGLITLVYEDENSAKAADVANAYVEELIHLTDTLALTEAQRRRLFYERQIENSKIKLKAAERAYRDSVRSGGVVVTEVDFQQKVKEVAELKAQMSAREIQLAVSRRFMSEDAPEVRRLAAELQVLKTRLSQREVAGMESLDFEKKGLDSADLFKEYKVQSATVEALARQLEFARLEEGKDGPLIQQIDKAIEPEFPTRPNRRFVLLTGAVLSLFMSALLVSIRAYYRISS